MLRFGTLSIPLGGLFMVGGIEETLRVNGRVFASDADVVVEVEEVFLHCPKAFIRSHLWHHEAWPASDALPSMACVLFDQIKPSDATLQDYERAVEEGNTKGLY